MIENILAIVFLWTLLGLIYFCNDVIRSKSGPDSWTETVILILLWPLRALGILK